MRPRTSLAERFATKYRVDASGCWLWIASLGTTGYGQINIGGEGRPLKAHRASWMLHRGDIPDGLHVCHRCDVRACVNPDHLFLGTDADNLADMARKRRSTWGARNPQAKLTDHDVYLIRLLCDAGVKQKTIAPLFGVRDTAISRIVNRQRWA